MVRRPSGSPDRPPPLCGSTASRCCTSAISPKPPPRSGRAPSRQTLRSRIRFHYRRSAYGSTLRLTLGCLLASQLGIRLQPVGSRRLNFADGEQVLSEWMAQNAFVTWVAVDEPWGLKEELLAQR